MCSFSTQQMSSPHKCLLSFIEFSASKGFPNVALLLSKGDLSS